MKSKWIIRATLSLILVSCGFGGDKADPLDGHTGTASYATDNERNGFEKAYQSQVEAGNAAHAKQVADITAKSNTAFANLKKEHEGIVAGIQAQCAGSKAEWDQQSEAFNAKFEGFKLEQQAEVKRCLDTKAEWERSAKACQETIDNAQKATIQGNFYAMNLQAYKLINGQKSPGIIFEFKLNVKGKNLISSITTEPELPAGLRITKSQAGENLWEISGTPNVDFNSGKTTKEIEVMLVPQIRYDAIEADKETIDGVRQEEIREVIKLIITKGAV